MELESRLLFSRSPHLLTEWNKKENEGINIDKITYGSKKKYWWTCPKCDSDYETSPELRSKGNGCSYCAGKKINHTNSFASLRPELVSQWHLTKNDLSPHEIALNSNKKYWWYCGTCKSTYDMPAIHKSRGVGCPCCSGRRILKEKSLGSLRPDLLKEWDYEKNKLNPFEVSPNTHVKAHWECEISHKYKASVKSRNLEGTGCPYCASRKFLKGFNDMWTTNALLASFLANPEDGYKYMQWSKEIVDWRCPDCDTLIKEKRISEVNNDGIGCPKCGRGASVNEKIMFNMLMQLDITIKTQKSFTWSERKRYDFYIPSKNMLIETHGGQHYNENGFSSLGGRTLKEEQENDRLKERLAGENEVLNYIIIDCRRSRFDFVKNNIMKSELSNIFDLSVIDWDVVKANSLQNLKSSAIKLWLSNSEYQESIA